jgi:hypothetical protein
MELKPKVSALLRSIAGSACALATICPICPAMALLCEHQEQKQEIHDHTRAIYLRVAIRDRDRGWEWRNHAGIHTRKPTVLLSD